MVGECIVDVIIVASKRSPMSFLTHTRCSPPRDATKYFRRRNTDGDKKSNYEILLEFTPYLIPARMP